MPHTNESSTYQCVRPTIPSYRLWYMFGNGKLDIR